LWLRSSRLSLRDTRASPPGRFPFMSRPVASPPTALDHHLAHTAIPARPPRWNSLGVFLDSTRHLLASFADGVSGSTATAGGPTGGRLNLPSPRPLKAGYAAPSLPAGCRFYPGHRTRPRARASTGIGSTPTCRCRSPLPLSSSPSPRLGVASRNQRLHRCALDGFLGPSSEMGAPTRILRHLPQKLCITNIA